MAISTIGTDALAASAVTSTKLASGVPSRSQLPAGTVLQVVYTRSTTPFVTASASFLDVGLSQAITPVSSSSKILVFASLHSDVAGPTGYGIQIVRNSTDVLTTWEATTYRNAASFRDNSTFIYLDSPGSSSALTYKVQVNNYNPSYAITFNETFGAGTYSSLTLMEIAA